MATVTPPSIPQITPTTQTLQVIPPAQLKTFNALMANTDVPARNTEYINTIKILFDNFNKIKIAEVNGIEIFKYTAAPSTSTTDKSITITQDKSSSRKIHMLSDLVLLMLTIFKIIPNKVIDITNPSSTTNYTNLQEYIETTLIPGYDPSKPASAWHLKQIYNIFISFNPFVEKDYSFNKSDQLSINLNELIKSDVHLQFFYDKYLDSSNVKLKEKWTDLIEQLSKLQLLIFLKKNKDADADDMMENLLTALNGKMKIVNSVLSQNITGEDDPTKRKYLKQIGGTDSTENNISLNTMLSSKYYKKYLKYKSRYLELSI